MSLKTWSTLTLLVFLIAVVTLPVGLLTALFMSVQAGAIVFIVGWFFLVPVIPLSYALYKMVTGGKDKPDQGEEDSALSTLKTQYARGEITEDEFFARIDNLVEIDLHEREQAEREAGNQDPDYSPEFEAEREW